MRPGFERAPIVARRNRHRIDPVHDAFVVRRRAIGIDHCERARLDHRPHDFLAAQIARRQFFRRDHAFDARFAAVAQVAQDAQIDPPAREFFDLRREMLDGGIDGVRAHRVAGIVEQMDDQHRADGRIGQRTHFDVARAAAALDDTAADLAR